MSHPMTRTTQHALLLVKAGALATIVALALGVGAPHRPAPPALGPTTSSADLTSSAQRLLDEHDCSPAGFGGAAQPRSAVIRSGSGRLRFVDFDTGWEVFTRHGRAELVATCLDRPPV